MANKLAELLSTFISFDSSNKKLKGLLGTGENVADPFSVPGKPDFMWVRVFRGTTQTLESALNEGAPRIKNLPVSIEQTDEGYIKITGPDMSNVSEFSDGTPGLTVGRHTHDLSHGNADMVETLRIMEGHFEIVSGLVIAINDINNFYWNGTASFFFRSLYNLSSHLPSNPNKWRWVKIGINSDTKLIEAVSGSETDINVNLSISSLHGIAFGSSDVMPMFGVKLAYGATTIERVTHLVDIRPWLSGTDSSISAAINNDGFITKTPSSNLSNEFALSTLATGILKNTTGTGVPTIAVADVDYQSPLTAGVDYSEPLTVEEDDLSPSVEPVTKIIFPNDSVTDEGSGVVRITFPTASAGDILVTSETFQVSKIIHDHVVTTDEDYLEVTIPSYDHIRIILLAKTDITSQRYQSCYLYFNDDFTDANYSYSQTQGNGSAGSTSAAASGSPFIGYATSLHANIGADNYANFQIDVPNISSADHWQTYTVFNSFLAEAEQYYQEYINGIWKNDDIVTKIRIKPAGSTQFVAGTRIVIIGYKQLDLVTEVSGDLESVVKQYEVPFAYNTTNPLLLRTALTDEHAWQAELIIDDVFDGAPSLTIGETGNTSRLMSSGQNDPFVSDIYVTRPNYTYPADTDIKLYITAGGATQGSGRVILTMR